MSLSAIQERSGQACELCTATVVLTKTLNVKGSTLNAKMGTVVKNIRLAPNDTGQIEGRVEGQLIVILTQYVRKQGR
jgi:protein PhnA